MATIVQQTNGEKTIYTADEYQLVQQQLATLTNNIGTNSAQLADFTPDISTLGAIGDGVADDTQAFQNAINSGIVYRLASGKTYSLTAPLTGSNILLICDGGATIYVDHSGDFMELSASSSPSPLLKNILVTKRNSYIKTGTMLNQTGGQGSTTVGNALRVDNVRVTNFDTAYSLQGMNWAEFKKSSISSCNTGLFLNGLGTPYASNNGNSFDLEITSCGTALKITGDALSNNFDRLILMSNTLACSADETGYAVQGLVNNVFNNLWCEQNTNDFDIKNGRGWNFKDIGHISGTSFFTGDSAFDSCRVENSNGQLVNAPIKGLTLISNQQYYPSTVLDAHASTDVSIRQTKEQTMINFPHVKTTVLSSHTFINPVYQSGLARQNLIGFTTTSSATNQVHENFDSTWTTPTNSGTMASSQSDPFGGTNGFKMTGSNTETKGHLNLTTSSAGRTFTFQILAKAVNPSENPKLSLSLESGTQILRNDFFLNRDGWNLYFVTVPFGAGATWINSHITVTTSSGILIARPCLYEKDIPGLAQRGNNDGIVVGENLVIENGCNKVYRNTAPTTGYWAQGDKVINTNPAASGNEGWICTTTGTPGTWKTYGTISA